jgi:hypothetical protein
MKAARIAPNAVAMTAAVRGAIAEVRPVNVAVAAIAPADPNAVTSAVPVHRKAVTNAATGPDAKGLDAGVVHATSAINANAVNRLHRCRRLALRCCRTIKASNHSRARFE